MLVCPSVVHPPTIRQLANSHNAHNSNHVQYFDQNLHTNTFCQHCPLLKCVTTFFDGQGFACVSVKVSTTTNIRKRYNQVPHLTQDTIWESNKNTINITNKSQEVRHFPAGDHKAAMKRRESMSNTRHKKAQVIHKRSTALERSLKLFYLRA